ncbi:hypothetical protein PR202_ga21208 [Eleusine coracana subsp. coracana]|uniref:Uncharacterized protein n=1 Tax=Eleusine coracana subsp. coracana TaxID=191504 RepID=A0AAV5D0H4_ELECO|nr:hypothetical protein PR202_ga21208 [Eleusine coracana subsp. coracana]
MDRVVELWMLWATLAVALIIYYLSILTRDSCSARQPPGPHPFPLIGNLLDLRQGHLHHTLARLARIHGPVMRLKLGLTTAVVISSRAAAREAFTRHDRRLAARAFRPSGGVVASHLFTPHGLASARGVREHKVRELVSYFRERARREVEVGHAVYSGVLNLVSNVICSVDVVDVGADSATGLRKLVEDLVELIATPNVSDLYPFLRSLDLQGWRRFAAKHLEKIFSILDGIVHHRVEEVRSSSSKETQNNDFLDALIELMSTGKMARDNVTSILFDVFTTGSDTIAITVEWAMAELLRNPSIMAKARAEIKGVLGDKETIEEPDAGSLPYLQAVVKEAMRLHPVPPNHVAAQGRGGRRRGQPKWTSEGRHFEFIPFGPGRRMCPGLSMAERVVPFILASLLHAFEWRSAGRRVSAEQLDVTEKFTTANVMAVPLRAVPVAIT